MSTPFPTLLCRNAAALTRTSVVVLSCLAIVAGLGGCPEDTTAPGPVTGFSATAGDAEVMLAWTNPADADLVGVRIVRKTGSAPTSPTDGNIVSDAAGTTFTDAMVSNGTEYFYAAFAYDAVPNYSTRAVASATPTSANAQAEILEEFAALSSNILGVPVEVLSNEQQQALLGPLHQAELLYRGDDPCGASELLMEEFLTKAQEYRQGNAIITVEELYNLGRGLRADMLLGLLVKAECPGSERVGMVAEAEVQEENSQQLMAAGVFGEPFLQTVRAKHEVNGEMVEELFTELQVPGAEPNQGAPGWPGIPIFRRLIAAPRGSQVMLLMKEAPEVAETIKMNLYPAQEEPVDPAPDPSVFENKPFVKNVEAYASDELYPPEPVTLTYLGDGRDMQFFLLEIAAGQFRPKSQVLQLFKMADVGVEFDGGTGAFMTDGMLNPFESNAQILTGAVINHTSVSRYIEGRVRPVLTGEEFMILTHPDFNEAAIALRDWKRSKGISTNVYLCGTGSDITGLETNAEIDAWIADHYDSVFIRPSYILLLGDAEFIAPFYVSGIGTDWPYAILGNVGVDQVPDFAVGRIPVDTLEQANDVVNKIIQYEDSPPVAVAFYRNAAIAAQFQCCRKDVATPGLDQRTFIEVSEFARNVLVTAGKTVDRIYTETIDAGCPGCVPPIPAYTLDPTPRKYYDGTLLPAAIGAGSGFGWAGDTADITAAWNDGRFLIMHRDHGWQEGWSHPEYWSDPQGLLPDDVDDLTNGAKLPVVFSVNCASGFWDNETAGGAYGTVPGEVYFAEKVLRKADGGAVGLLCDTRNSPSWANSVLTQGFFDAVWPNAIGTFGDATPKRRLGDILNHGKLYVMSKVGFTVMGQIIDNSSAVSELYLWHCLGDPTLEIWTGYPYLIPLPIEIKYRWIGWWPPEEIPRVGGINLEYAINGAEISIFEVTPKQAVEPLGRGKVVNGIANITFLHSHNVETPLLFFASLENSLSKQLQAKAAD